MNLAIVEHIAVQCDLPKYPKAPLDVVALPSLVISFEGVDLDRCVSAGSAVEVDERCSLIRYRWDSPAI